MHEGRGFTALSGKNSATTEGTTTITLERDGFTFVIKEAPARVCTNCGEAYVEEKIVGELFKSAEKMACSGALVDIRCYKAA